MIKIEVTEKQQTRLVNGKNGQIQLIEQDAYAHLPAHKYPVLIKLTPPRGQSPYTPGLYQLSPDSFYVGRFGQLELSPRLLPLGAAQVKAA